MASQTSSVAAKTSVECLFDSMLENPTMTDEFDYFSLIGRGGSCTPDKRTPEREEVASDPESSHTRAMSLKGKEPVSRVSSHGETKEKVENSMRPRTNSMPSKDHLLRVRNFQTTGKKFQNRGDTVKSASHSSLVSSHSNSSDAHSDSEENPTTSQGSNNELLNRHRILLLGGDGVGKTALTQQFLTSDDISGAEYLDDGKEKYCTVQVDGEESFLIFMDQDFDKNNYDPSSASAYIVVYSCTDRESYEEATKLLRQLRHFEKTKAIILCGNKSDLVRKRKVTFDDGKQLAHEYDAKFVESSIMLNHKVDNILVEILRQIKEQERQSLKHSSKKSHKSTGFRKSVKGLVGKIVHRGSGKKTQPSTP